MPRRPRLIQLPLVGIVFLCVLAIVYQGYLVALAGFLYTKVLVPSPAIVEHAVNTAPSVEIKYWTAANMSAAIDVDQFNDSASNLTQESTNAGKAARQPGQPPGNGDPTYPLTTVGRIFMTNDAGQNMSCSGTAVKSANQSVVDTAGHCLYLYGKWVQNLIFCPQYDHGETPFGCWAARDLEVPSDWINARINDYHHDFGMAIVAPNDQGLLTDLVGGAGWAYNQPVNQPFYAYGYPARAPFDGESRQSCESSSGTSWQQGDGTVVSIPCNMTGGSSGGPWFIKSGGNWYLNGHNDFTSSIKPDHMFSPYYDDTWYALYDKAQHT